MIIVLKQNAPEVQVREFCHELQDMGLQINDSKGSESHILGLIGDTKAVAESWVLANPVVETCRRVTEPYKKANRKFHPDDSVIDVDGVKIGGGNFAVIAGPCSIESEEQITYCAQRVKAAGASLLRGGAFKPRTSPYSFQGMRSEGLDLLKLARRATGAPIVTASISSAAIPCLQAASAVPIWRAAAVHRWPRVCVNWQSCPSRAARRCCPAMASSPPLAMNWTTIISSAALCAATMIYFKE